MITARALGVYLYLQATDSNISAESLSAVFPEGRKVFLAALKELREHGLIITSRAVINGKYVTYSKLSDGSPKTELLSLQPQLNSKLNLIANSYKSKPNSERSSREEPKMEYYETKEELEEAKRKSRERKHKAKLEVHEKRREQRMERRSDKNSEGWSVTDVTFEFAEQMHALWHVQPWQVTRSRFRYALSQKREEFNTDGAIEKVMIGLFLGKIKHDTRINDPEKIWKNFIVQFSNLLIEAQRLMVTPEDIDLAKEKAKKTLDWMDNV